MENPQLPLNLVFPLARAHAHVEKSRIRQAIEDVLGDRLASIENKLTQQNQNQENIDQHELDTLRGINDGLQMNLAKKKAQITTLEVKAQRLQNELDECRATGTSTRQELVEKEAEIARVIATAEYLNEGAQKLEDDLEGCHKQKLAGDNRLVEQEDTIRLLQEELARAEAEYANCLREKEQLNSGNDELNDLRQQITAKENELLTLRTENQSALATAIADRDQLRSSLQDKESLLEQNQLSLQTAQLALTEALGSRNEVPGPVQQELEESHRQALQKGEDCRQELRLIQQQLAEKDAEIATLKEGAKEKLEYSKEMTKKWHGMFKDKEKKAIVLQRQLETALAGRDKLRTVLEDKELSLATAQLALTEALTARGEEEELEEIYKKAYLAEVQKVNDCRLIEQQLAERDAEIVTLKESIRLKEIELTTLREENQSALLTAQVERDQLQASLDQSQLTLSTKQSELSTALEYLNKLWSNEDSDEDSDEDSHEDSDEEVILFDPSLPKTMEEQLDDLVQRHLKTLEDLRAELTECREARRLFQEQLEAKDDEIAALTNNAKSLKEKVEELQTKLNETTGDKDFDKTEAGNLRELADAAVQEAEKSRDELKEVIREKNDLFNELREMKTSEIEEKEAELELLRQEGIATQEELVHKQKHIDHMLASVDENAKELVKAKEECEDKLKEKAEKLEKALQDLETLSLMNDSNDMTLAENNRKDMIALDALYAEINELKARETEDMIEFDALYAEINELKARETKLREELGENQEVEEKLSKCDMEKERIQQKLNSKTAELALAIGEHEQLTKNQAQEITRLGEELAELKTQLESVLPVDTDLVKEVQNCEAKIVKLQKDKESEIAGRLRNGNAKRKADMSGKDAEIRKLRETVENLRMKAPKPRRRREERNGRARGSGGDAFTGGATGETDRNHDFSYSSSSESDSDVFPGLKHLDAASGGLNDGGGQRKGGGGKDGIGDGGGDGKGGDGKDGIGDGGGDGKGGGGKGGISDGGGGASGGDGKDGIGDGGGDGKGGGGKDGIGDGGGDGKGGGVNSDSGGLSERLLRRLSSSPSSRVPRSRGGGGVGGNGVPGVDPSTIPLPRDVGAGPVDRYRGKFSLKEKDYRDLLERQEEWNTKALMKQFMGVLNIVHGDATYFPDGAVFPEGKEAEEILAEFDKEQAMGRLDAIVEILGKKNPSMHVLPTWEDPKTVDLSTRKLFKEKVPLVELRNTHVFQEFKENEFLAKGDNQKKKLLFLIIVANCGLKVGDRGILNPSRGHLPVLGKRNYVRKYDIDNYVQRTRDLERYEIILRHQRRKWGQASSILDEDLEFPNIPDNFIIPLVGYLERIVTSPKSHTRIKHSLKTRYSDISRLLEQESPKLSVINGRLNKRDFGKAEDVSLIPTSAFNDYKHFQEKLGIGDDRIRVMLFILVVASYGLRDESGRLILSPLSEKIGQWVSSPKKHSFNLSNLFLWM